MPIGTREEKDEAIPVVEKLVMSLIKMMQKAGAAGDDRAKEAAEGSMRRAVAALQRLRP